MSLKPKPLAGLDIRSVYFAGRAADAADGRLLEQFRSGRGPAADAAFAALLERHGPMVLRVCRGVLNDEHDAQDAFQATFLILVRQAGSIRAEASVGSWLFGVAHRVALKARSATARRRSHERRVAKLSDPHRRDGGPEGGSDGGHPAIDEEIHRLPEKYRAPVLLCCLEGLTQERAAEQLGWPSGTVRGRLARARKLLRDRLERRGVTLPAAAPTAVPPSLLEATARTAATAAAGQGVSGTVAYLAATAAPAALSGAFGLAGSGALVANAVAGLGVLAVTAATLGAVVWAVSGTERAPARRPPDVVVTDNRPTDTLKTPVPTPDAAPDPVATTTRPDDPPDAGPPSRSESAVAVPLRGITIDGDLKDWPAAMPRHSLRKIFLGPPQYGYGGLEGADLSNNPDLSAAFSVGYDPEEQLLYLAVTVRDDSLIIGHTSHLDTDAVEVYIDGLHSERRMPIPAGWTEPDRVDLSTIPAQQYVAIPGSGKIYGTNYGTNPVLLSGDLRKTRTRMAFRREGDVTTYEWAIQPFDRYPDRPTKLEPGKRIGFDLAVADKDVPAKSPQGMNEPEADRTAWIYWGPRWTGVKTFNAGNLGELVLGK
jgi:RNA polymerase sigma factor (sigma-70 family)